MVRRSRACLECRQRRMRCDETLPHCVQCQKASRMCSGPAQDMIIVDMTLSTASHPGLIHTPRVAREAKHRELSNTFIPLLRAPPAYHAISELFVARFITYFCGSHTRRGKKSWMMSLPEILPSNIRGPTIKISLDAASMVHYAIEAAEPDTMIQSHQMYAKALRLHRKFIPEVLSIQSLPSSVAFEMVASSVILAFFEAMRCTDINAYGFHICAAARFLEIIGPERCSYGLLNQLFFTIRSQTAFISAATHTSINFSTQAWSEVPYDGLPMKPISERAMDSIIALLQISAMRNSSIFSQTESDRARGSICLVRSQLEELQSLCANDGKPHEHGVISGVDSPIPIYRDPFTALNHMHINCAWLMLSSLSVIFDDDVLLGLEAKQCCNSILSGVGYLESQSIGCAYMRMILPLFLVALKSPTMIQRQYAMDKLRTWEAGNLMSGLCAVALYYAENSHRYFLPV